MTRIRTTTEVDTDLIQARWACLHSTWAGDLIGMELAWAHVDELLDERQGITRCLQS
jgi:hypothetical protein